MSMLNFYINRAGKNLPQGQKKVLEQAKIELRKLFGKNKNRRRERDRFSNEAKLFYKSKHKDTG